MKLSEAWPIWKISGGDGSIGDHQVKVQEVMAF